MKANPGTAKYRNLYARGGIIYYQRRVGQRRSRGSHARAAGPRAVAGRSGRLVFFGFGDFSGTVPGPVPWSRFGGGSSRKCSEVVPCTRLGPR